VGPEWHNVSIEMMPGQRISTIDTSFFSDYLKILLYLADWDIDGKA